MPSLARFLACCTNLGNVNFLAVSVQYQDIFSKLLVTLKFIHPFNFIDAIFHQIFREDSEGIVL
jgi:hypothetical protein